MSHGPGVFHLFTDLLKAKGHWRFPFEDGHHHNYLLGFWLDLGNSGRKSLKRAVQYRNEVADLEILQAGPCFGTRQRRVAIVIVIKHL